MTKELAVPGYKDLLQDLRTLLTKAKYQAYKAVDNLRVQTYWQMGERITRESLVQKRADYGQEVVPHLAQDLLMQKSTLYDILHFYAAYPIFHAVRGELSWTHYRLLMRIDRKEEREFYESQIIGNAWSSRQLEHEIKMEQFQHKHVSQMYSYLNWYKQHKVQEGQRPPIGLIICKTKDNETVHYALGDLKKEIFVAEYKTRLPPKEKILTILQ